MLIVIILLIKVITAITSLKNSLKVIGYYLLGNVILDFVSCIIKYINHCPKPYTGLGFWLFSITTFCYLANNSWLLFCTGMTLKNSTLKQVSILSLITILTFVLTAYPGLHGESMLRVWYSWYLSSSLICLILLVKNLKSNLSWNNSIMLMFSLGCIAEIFVILLFGYQYYFVISICNFLFYFVVLGVCVIAPKYNHLLKP